MMESSQALNRNLPNRSAVSTHFYCDSFDVPYLVKFWILNFLFGHAMNYGSENPYFTDVHTHGHSLLNDLRNCTRVFWFLSNFKPRFQILLEGRSRITRAWSLSLTHSVYWPTRTKKVIASTYRWQLGQTNGVDSGLPVCKYSTNHYVRKTLVPVSYTHLTLPTTWCV